MPKPKEIYLLEVKYTGVRYHRGPGGGIFRTERDMNERIDTIKSRIKRFRSNGPTVHLTISKLTANWEFLDEEEYSG